MAVLHSNGFCFAAVAFNHPPSVSHGAGTVKASCSPFSSPLVPRLCLRSKNFFFENLLLGISLFNMLIVIAETGNSLI